MQTNFKKVADTPARPLAVLHVLTSQAWGGLELYSLQLIQKCMLNGTRVALYCRPFSKVSQEAKQMGIPLYDGYSTPHLGFRDALRIRKILKDNKFNIIHSHTRHDVRYASLALFCYSEARHIFSLYMSAPSKKDLFHRFIYARVHAIVSSSEILNEKIRKNYPVHPGQVHLLRYGKDLSLYKRNNEERNKIRARWNTQEDDLVIGTMCRIDPAKGVKEIANAFLLLSQENQKKVKIWIIGEPTLEYTMSDGTPVYEKKSQELFLWLQDFIKQDSVNKHIEHIPFQKNIIPCLSSFDIFILGTYKETYSLSVIDAMCMDIPVIGTNSGGTVEQLNAGSRGLLVEPQSAAALAQAMTTFIENPQMMKQMSHQAKVWASAEHDWQHTLKKLSEIYFKILE